MRVWVTRDEERDGALSAALRDVGLEVVLMPVIERCAVGDCASEVGGLGVDDWLVLTSPFAVASVALSRALVAVTGEVSAEAARRRGFRVALVSAGGDARSLFTELRRRVSEGVICYPRSSRAEVPVAWDGVSLVSPVLYETRARAFDADVVDRVDVVAFTSASAVEAVGRVNKPCASLGPSTSAALRAVGIDPWVEAAERSFESLAGAIADQRRSSRNHRA